MYISIAPGLGHTLDVCGVGKGVILGKELTMNISVNG